MGKLLRREAKLKLVVVVLVSLLASLLVTGCNGEEETQELEAVIPVEVAEAKKDKLVEPVVVSGKLEAFETSNVVPSGQGGKVVSVNVKVGDSVSKGATLVTLENTILAAQVRQAEQSVVQAKSNLDIARIDYEQTKANYERGKMLYEQGAIPQVEFENSYEIPYKKAENNFINIAPAGLESAEAQLAMAQEQYNNAFIKSPIAGVVTAVNVNPGELASPGVPSVSVANINRVVVKATVAESIVNEFKRGDEVKVNISAVSTEPFTGKITSIAPAADQASRAFPIEVELDNPDGKLKPGMFAEIELFRTHSENVVVPREAVSGYGVDGIVWVLVDGVAERREVETGADNSQAIIILSGVEEGEQVVIVGADSLREGVEVEIREQVE